MTDIKLACTDPVGTETLTHCIQVESSTVIYWTSPFVLLGESDLFCHFILFLMEILLANNVDPDQTPHFVASDPGLHSLSITLLRVSR